jgi:quercetin dioxygenase-like cupin family protein
VPSALNLVQVQRDFDPGAWTPAHWHDGPLLVTVVEGELTMRQQGAERTLKAGDLWIEYPGVVHTRNEERGRHRHGRRLVPHTEGGRLTSLVQ